MLKECSMIIRIMLTSSACVCVYVVCEWMLCKLTYIKSHALNWYTTTVKTSENERQQGGNSRLVSANE